MLVQERGIDFDPTDEYLQEVRLAGGEDELVSALKSAKVVKPVTVDPVAQARQAEVQQHAARGAEFMRDKRYADAEMEYRAAVRLDPQNSDLHFSLGNALANKRDDWDGAIAELREALRLNPDNEWAHALLGGALGEKGDLEGEIEEDQEVVRLDPNRAEPHALLGGAFGDKGDLDGAIAEYREALHLNPKYEDGHVSLGVALGNKGDWNGEIIEEREALRLNPSNDLTHYNLGAALGREGDWDGLIAEEREALRINPNNDMAHNRKQYPPTSMCLNEMLDTLWTEVSALVTDGPFQRMWIFDYWNKRILFSCQRERGKGVRSPGSLV